MSSSQSSSSNSETSLPPDISRLQDVVCRVSVVLGTGTVSVRDCLALTRNKVIKLAQVAGTDLQVLVNGIPIAHGEVVIIEDYTSIRLTDILSPPSASTQ
jgi:flagellar motor switch protein FliN/FliY